ncbi:DUF1707 SHOCT-like domain-containing protein [Pseudonocardia sp. GCM10023141]|uniref:DUF1707 SHOCT-like domain-containing protein n=1 Tax=Pseudonocardia sp. GCM10023141 TaxID=3252653 RepID=UPI00361AEFAD
MSSTNDTAALRVSDADRTAAAARLEAAVADGRLTVSEYDERLRNAYGAVTRGELDQLTADLPVPGNAPQPVESMPSRGTACSSDLRNWVLSSMFFTAIWAWSSIASGHLLFFWPLFIILFSGTGVAGIRLRRHERPRLSRR